MQRRTFRCSRCGAQKGSGNSKCPNTACAASRPSAGFSDFQPVIVNGPRTRRRAPSRGPDAPQPRAPRSFLAGGDSWERERSDYLAALAALHDLAGGDGALGNGPTLYCKCHQCGNEWIPEVSSINQGSQKGKAYCRKCWTRVKVWTSGTPQLATLESRPPPEPTPEPLREEPRRSRQPPAFRAPAPPPARRPVRCRRVEARRPFEVRADRLLVLRKPSGGAAAIAVERISSGRTLDQHDCAAVAGAALRFLRDAAQGGVVASLQRRKTSNIRRGASETFLRDTRTLELSLSGSSRITFQSRDVNTTFVCFPEGNDIGVMRRDGNGEDAVIYELVRRVSTPTGKTGQWFEVVPTEGDLALVHAGPGAITRGRPWIGTRALPVRLRRAHRRDQELREANTRARVRGQKPAWDPIAEIAAATASRNAGADDTAPAATSGLAAADHGAARNGGGPAAPVLGILGAPPAVAAPAAAAAPRYARNTPAQCRTILDEMNGVLAPGAFFDGAVAPFGFPARPCQLLAMDPGCERALKHCLALGRLQAETSEGGVVGCVDDDMVLRQAYSLLCQTERPYLTEVFRQKHGLHFESDAHYEGICSLYTLAPVGLFTGFVWECLALAPRPIARLLKNQAWHDYHERYYGKAAVRAAVAAHGAATSQ